VLADSQAPGYSGELRRPLSARDRCWHRTCGGLGRVRPEGTESAGAQAGYTSKRRGN
jgi:hypothetical protein